MLVADMQDVAESFRDQQSRRLALALDQHVGDDGGGMDHDAIDIARADPGCLHHVRHAGEKSLQQVVMGGQHLVDGQHARRVTQHDVREGAADIDRERIRHCCPFQPRSRDTLRAASMTAPSCAGAGFGAMTCVEPTIAIEPTSTPR